MESLKDLLMASSGSALRSLVIWSWQVFLLLGVVWLALKLDRSRSPLVRYRIWLLGLIAAALLPLSAGATRLLPLSGPEVLTYVLEIPSAITAPSPPSESNATSVAGAGAETLPPEPRQWSSFLLPFFFLIWFAGAVVTLTRFAASFLTLHRVRADARQVSAAELECGRVDRRLESGAVRIELSDGVQTPLLAGLIHPVILLPADIVSWTTVEERTSILRHELVHITRRDHFVNFFQALLNTVFFFHPLVRYASHRLNVERELACDDRVLSLGTGPAVYAESILKVAERNLLPDAVHQPAAFASRRTLEGRIELILSRRRGPASSRLWPFLVLPVALIAAMIWVFLPVRSITVSPEDANAIEPAQAGSAYLKPQIDRSVSVSKASSAELPGVEQILDNYVQALGGEAAIRSVSSRVIKGTIDWNGSTGTAEHYTQAPGKYMSITRLSNENLSFSEGFDGTRGWLVGLNRSRDWTGDEAAAAKRQRAFYRDADLKALYSGMKVVGTERIGERDAYVIEATTEAGGIERLSFDKRTGLLLHQCFQVEGPAGSREFEYYFDDYRNVDGVKVAFTRLRTKPVPYVIKLAEVSHNVPIDDARFDKPAPSGHFSLADIPNRVKRHLGSLFR